MGGLPVSTVIAVATSIGGAVGFTVFACCLQRLHKGENLSEDMKIQKKVEAKQKEREAEEAQHQDGQYTLHAEVAAELVHAHY